MYALGSRIAAIVLLAAASVPGHGSSVRAGITDAAVAESMSPGLAVAEMPSGSVVDGKAASAASTLALTTSAFAVTAPAQVTLTATVSGTGLKGSIAFKSGSTVVGTATINKNTATLKVALPAAIHSLTAVFAGTAGDIVSPRAVVVVDNALTCS